MHQFVFSSGTLEFQFLGVVRTYLHQMWMIVFILCFGVVTCLITSQVFVEVRRIRLNFYKLLQKLGCSILSFITVIGSYSDESRSRSCFKIVTRGTIHQSFVGKSFQKFPKCWGSSRCQGQSRSFLDGQPPCPWTTILRGMTIPIFLTWTTLMDGLEFIQSSVHHWLPLCPRVIQSTVEFIAVLWTSVSMTVIRYRATCHDLIGNWSL